MRVGVDTGGTFTDFVWLEGGRLATLKVASTPDDPARAVLAGLRTIARGGGGEPPDVLHGTTVATNALLEGRGEPVALLTNAGFEDLIEIGRQERPALYSFAAAPPEPLVPRDLRFGVAGRRGPDGNELTPLDLDGVGAAAREAARAGVRRFAVCFLHSWAAGRHEEAAGEVLAAAGAEVTLSSRVLPEYREVERFSTTLVNARLGPVLSGYLARLEAGMAGGRLSVFRSNGGLLSAAAAGEEAVQALLSGPAAGVIGALGWAARTGLGPLLTFDMGGTSTDAAIADGRAPLTREARVGGYPIGVPMLDIETVGAGGGSIARRDSGGALVVGPQSAGADPGPACYGRGDAPTVTDAHVVLGRLPADSLLGGSVRVDAARAVAAIDRLGATVGLDRRRCAAGIVEVANAVMARALRRVSVARGRDPRDLALFCFGGAGGLHAAELAAALGMREVIVPPAAGTFSAWGLLEADRVRDAARGVLEALADCGRDRRDALAAPLEAALREAMAGESGAGPLRFERQLDLRYRGQSYEISVPEGDDPANDFHCLHRERYSHDRRQTPVEIVALRVRAIVPTARVELSPLGRGPAEWPPRPARRVRPTWSIDFGAPSSAPRASCASSWRRVPRSPGRPSSWRAAPRLSSRRAGGRRSTASEICD